MSRNYAMNLRRAARSIGVPHSVLIDTLRRHRFLMAGNLPTIETRRAGLFRVVTAGFFHAGYQREVAYQKVIVTAAGLQWLQELIDADRRGEVAPPLGAGNSGLADTRGATRAARTGAVEPVADRESASRECLGETPKKTTAGEPVSR